VANLMKKDLKLPVVIPDSGEAAGGAGRTGLASAERNRVRQGDKGPVDKASTSTRTLKKL